MIKYIPYIVAVVSVVALLTGAGAYLYQSGKAACKAEYAKELADFIESSQKESKKMEKGYASASKKIQEVASGGCVGDANRYVDNWLREHYTGE